MSNLTDTLKLALDALELAGKSDDFRSYEKEAKAMAALRSALANTGEALDEQWTPEDMAYRPGGLPMDDQPAQKQEPVATFKWLPEGTTHLGRISVRVCAGGSLAMSTHAFKYDNGVLKVYDTDNDNEYPGWRDAKDVFFHLNFPVIPLYTSPPRREWVGLTDEEIDQAFSQAAPTLRKIYQVIEAKLKEKNCGHC